MLNYIVSFVAFGAYLTLESYLRNEGKCTKKFNYLFLCVGVVGLIITNIVNVFYFEYFFLMTTFMSLLNLWKERKK